jgi:hypothetical protein
VLSDSAFFETVFENAAKVNNMFKELGWPWPSNFPLQAIIDQNEGTAERHGLPTSKALQAREADGLPELPSIDF